MVFTPYKDDRHFSAEGHALFAKFLTDAEVARAAVDYTNSPIAIFGRLASSQPIPPSARGVRDVVSVVTVMASPP